jgi:hypothetical protein
MRRTLTLCRTGLAGVAAVVLLTACGGNDDTSASSSSASGSPSAGSAESSGSGSASGSEFCTQAASLENTLSAPDLSDPASAGPAIADAASQVRAIDPPAEISDDWTALADGLDQLGQILTTTDLNDPAQASAAQQQVSQLEADLGDASTNVSNYLSSECGIGNDSSQSAAPTS